MGSSKYMVGPLSNSVSGAGGPFAPMERKIRDLSGELRCTDVHTNADGTLSHTTELWCEHINKFINNNNDSQEIFEACQQKLDQDVIVPIFPSLDRFTMMRLHSLVPGPAYAVDWQGESLGYINQGEGRAALRLMLLDHLNERMRTAECQYPSHGYKEQMAWEQAENLGKSDKPAARKGRAVSLAQRFAVVVEGACLECLKGQGNFDDDDLIPDVPGSRRGFPKGAGTGSGRR